MGKAAALLLLTLAFITSDAAAAGVPLPADQRFERDGVECGLIDGSWVPGVLLANGNFYSHDAKLKALRKKLKKAKVSAKAKIRKQIRNLNKRRASEEPVCAPGPDTAPTPTPTPAPTGTPTFALSSSSITSGAAVPQQFTCSGSNISPVLAWQAAPAGTASYLVLLDDPDASFLFTHWIVYNIPADVTSLAENAGAAGSANLPTGAIHGYNDFATNFYQGPCPPPGESHRYYYRVYALDVASLTLATDPLRTDIDAAIQGHVLGQAELMGVFSR